MAARRTVATTLALLILPLVLGGQALAGEWDGLKKRLAADGFAARRLDQIFDRPELSFDPRPMATKMRELFRARQEPRTGEAKPTSKVYPGYINAVRINEARAFMRQHGVTLDRVSREHGVPREIPVAIMAVETRLGRFLGRESAFVNLASMAACRDFDRIKPHLTRLNPSEEQWRWLKTRSAEKADWAYEELKALLVYARKNNLDPKDLPGSIYGAIGHCQFMPTNALRFGADGNGDGVVDLFCNEDALASIGRYLAAYGWRAGIDKKAQRQVIWEYNHSQVYVNTVMAVADRLKAGAKSPAGKTNKAKGKSVRRT